MTRGRIAYNMQLRNDRSGRLRRPDHRCGPQRPGLRLLSRPRGPQGAHARTARRGRRRGGDRGVPSRLPQLDRELHGEPAAAEGDPRHAARRARAAHRRAADLELRAAAGRRASALGGELAATQAEVARFSARDAEALPRLLRALDAVAEVLRGLVLRAPPNLGGPLSRRLARRARQRRGCCSTSAACPWRQARPRSTSSPRARGDLLDQLVRERTVKAVFGLDAVVGNYASPYAAGSAYVLLHHVFGEVNGKQGALGPCDRRHGRDHRDHGRRCRSAASRSASKPGGSGAGRRRKRGRRRARERRGVARARCRATSARRSCTNG